MKIIRGSFLFFAVIFLVLSLFIGNIFLIVFLSLNYNTLYPELSSNVNEFYESKYNLSANLSGDYNSIVDYCSYHNFYLYNNLVSANVSCLNINSGIDSTLNSVLEQNPSVLEQQNTLVRLSNDLIDSHSSMVDYCSAHEVYSLANLKINVSCEDVLAGKDEFKEAVIKKITDDVYYKNYKCNFWDCVSKTGSTFFLVSDKAVDYWKSKFNLFCLISLVLLVLIYFLLEDKVNFFFVLGSSLIVSCIPLLKVEPLLLYLVKYLFIFFGNILPSGLEYLIYLDSDTILSIISIFFVKAGFVFYSFFSLGILLIISGIVLKFWKFFTGRTKKMFSRREVEDIVKKEFKKPKIKSP